MPRLRGRGPRFRDPVELDGSRFTVIGTLFAPQCGVLVRPVGAEGASTDRIILATEWVALTWDSQAQRWQAA